MFKQMRVLKNGLTFTHHLVMLSHVQLFATPWTVAHQAPLATGFPGKINEVGSHFLLQEIPDPGTEPTSLTAPPGRV